MSKSTNMSTQCENKCLLTQHTFLLLPDCFLFNLCTLCALQKGCVQQIHTALQKGHVLFLSYMMLLWFSTDHMIVHLKTLCLHALEFDG